MPTNFSKAKDFCFDGDPFFFDVKMWINRNGEPATNLPWLIAEHSPTGFNWGYNGSGPADLALNILYTTFGDKYFAWKHHQEFKQKFISKIKSFGGIIEKGKIEKWFLEKKQDAINSFLRGEF